MRIFKCPLCDGEGTADLREENAKLTARIAELKEYIKQLIETGDAMSNAYPNWMREEDDWEALVKKVERELGEVKA